MKEHSVVVQIIADDNVSLSGTDIEGCLEVAHPGKVFTVKETPEVVEALRGLIAILESIMLQHPDYADETDWQLLSAAQNALAKLE